MSGYLLPAEVEEQEVLRSWDRNDQDGLDLLYRRYAAPLTAFCHHRLGNRSEAEDAAHDTILKAYRALPHFRSGARLWPWLATIAANVCTDMQRSRERWAAHAEVTPAEGFDEHVAQRARARIVGLAIAELPERFRTPLVLREFMGWSYEEIAVFSHKTVGSVRSTLLRARRALQSRVEDVARRQGQWPLPVAVVARWRRMRLSVRQWRRASLDWRNRLLGSLWQTEGLASLVSGGAQAAVTALAAVSALTAAPASAAAGAPLAMVATPAALSTPSAGAVPSLALARPQASGPAASGDSKQAAARPQAPSAAAPRSSTTEVTVPGVPVSAGQSSNRAHDGYEEWDIKPSVSVAGNVIAPVGGGMTWPGCATTVNQVMCTVFDRLSS